MFQVSFSEWGLLLPLLVERPVRPRGGSRGAEVPLNGTFNRAATFNIFYTFNWTTYCALYKKLFAFKVFFSFDPLQIFKLGCNIWQLLYILYIFHPGQSLYIHNMYQPTLGARIFNQFQSSLIFSTWWRDNIQYETKLNRVSQTYIVSPSLWYKVDSFTKKTCLHIIPM